MAEVTLTINGRNYGISCDDGQEKRVRELGYYVDQRLKEIGRAGAATNESHLLVLTAIMLADEIFDARDHIEDIREHAGRTGEMEEEGTMAARAINHLAGRISLIADRIQKA